MKKQRFFMLGIITVLVAVLSLTFVSSTFAKYTSTVSGDDSAKVAKWEWAFSGDVTGDDHSADTLTVDLFKTAIYDLNAEDRVDLSSPELHVSAGSGQPLIAPGTGGKAEFVIKNTSQVDATYEINFTADEKTVRLEWSSDNTVWKDNIQDLDVAATNIDKESGTATVTLYWRWTFDDATDSGSFDNGDTALGQTPVEPTVDVEVIFTQID